MKLLIILSHNPYFESSASANRWLSLIEGLLVLGVNITLLFTWGISKNPELEEVQKLSKVKRLNYQYFSKLSNETLWKRRFNRYLWEPMYKPFQKKKILNCISKNQDGIVWTNADLASFELVVALKKRNPLQKTFLEMSEFLDIHSYNLGNALQRKLGDKRQFYFENQALYSYDGLALMTKTLYSHYGSFKGNLPKLLHLPMTVNLERFETIEQTEISEKLIKPYITFIGVMNNKKDGVNILIEAFACIADEFPDLVLYLFGPYNYDTTRHLEQIKNLEMQNRIFYKGEVASIEVPSILKKARLLTLPRPDSKQAQGGFPTKLGEYLASGTPVCATTVGELPMYLKDEESVFFAKPGDTDSFVNALQRALRNPELAIKIGIEGKKVAQTYFNKDIQSKLLYDFLIQL
jgi:glycosyltransferase involved in cell wall biosynthesis